MVSTSGRFTDNIPMSPGPPMIFKKISARKSLRLFTEVLDIKNKTSVRRLGAAKSKRKEIISGSMLWLIITNRKGHTKINEQVEKYIYNWILQYSQAVKYPISNYFLKVYIDGHSKPQLVPKLLLQVSVQ